jgi:gliding motility-associated transport system ATP-binding protein
LAELANHVAMLEVRNLKKSFAGNPALRNISLSAQRGEVVALVGRNGAGKSTLMRIIAGCLPPDDGEIQFQDGATIGYLPEGAPLYKELSPRACLKFALSAHGIHGRAQRLRITDILQSLDLEDTADLVLGTLSKGYQRRAALGMALAPDPHILILDEPFDGFDPIQKHAAVKLLKRLAAQKMILISTHTLSDAKSLCTRLVVIDHGLIRADDAPKAILKQTKSANLDSAFRKLVGNAS